jgi:Lipoprotein LpqB beta-propeller domain/Sporulation and spore germination
MPAGGSVRPGRRGRPSRRRSRRWLAAAGSLLAVLVSACATLPGNSSVQQVRVASRAGAPDQGTLQMIPVPPQPDWYSGQVVTGFLAALASFKSDPQVAREYLTGPGSSTWDPQPGVVVLSRPLSMQEVKSPNNSSAGLQNANLIMATGTEVASLTSNGQYLTDDPAQSVSYAFNMLYFGPSVGWRISISPQLHLSAPAAPLIPLLITQQDFDSLYTPRNLYFLAASSHSLVPDPVLVPVQATSVDLARQLVSALRSSPAGWLETAVTTAFPVNTPPPQVTIAAGTATVNLSGAAAAVGKQALQQMLAQVLWTLTSSSSQQQQPIAQSVQLAVNGVVKASASAPAGCCGPQGSIAGYVVPEPQRDAPLYTIAAHGVINQLTISPGGSLSISPATGEAGLRGPALSRIAVSPDGRYIAAITQSGNAVYYGSLASAKLTEWSEGGGYTSVSWDDQDNLWVAGPPQQVWQLPLGGPPTALSLQHVPQTQGALSQFQIAPDGVRYAIIVNQPDGKGPELQIGAITYTSGGAVASQPQVTIGVGVSDPTDVSWYDANNLIVLSGSPADPQLWEVPVDNQQSSTSTLPTEPGAQSVSAAGPGNPIVEGLEGGRLALIGIGGGEHTINTNVGLDPTYPS